MGMIDFLFRGKGLDLFGLFNHRVVDILHGDLLDSLADSRLIFRETSTASVLNVGAIEVAAIGHIVDSDTWVQVDSELVLAYFVFS